MRRSRCSDALVAVLLVAGVAAMPVQAEVRSFVHATTVENVSSNSTWLDDPSANGDPKAILFVGPPGGEMNVANGHPIGVWYDSSMGRWAVFHQDRTSMPAGIVFQIFSTSGSSAFVHRASAKNTEDSSSFIDSPLCNGQPSAAVLITPNWNPPGSGGVYDPHAIGVRYEKGRGQWVIFHQDLAPMPEGAAFNVLIGEGSTWIVVAQKAAPTDGKSVSRSDAPADPSERIWTRQVTVVDPASKEPSKEWSKEEPSKEGQAREQPPKEELIQQERTKEEWAKEERVEEERIKEERIKEERTKEELAKEERTKEELIQEERTKEEWARKQPTKEELIQEERAREQRAKEEQANANQYPGATTIDPSVVLNPSERIDWDFEDGAYGWTATGTAFENQPTAGDNVVASRVRVDMTLANGGIGGDYWKNVPYPIGHHDDFWVGTYEDHPSDTGALGVVQNDAPTGTLTSGDFPLDDAHRFIAFVVGGGGDVGTERVELQIRGESDEDIAEIERLVGSNRGAYSALGALFGGTVRQSVAGVASRDGDYVVALTATGQRSEVLRPVVFEVPETLRGRRGRIRIVDASSDSWGHINADDFRFGATAPPARAPRVWGFVDTHTHPGNNLSFGGNLVQGALYPRDGSPFASDQYRRTALPPLFENIDWARLGSLSGFFSPFYGGGIAAVPGLPPLDPVLGALTGEAARVATRPARMGYPDMRSYPNFNQMLGQQMYGEWIHRAYDGGLRLMSALAVNTWLVSAHPVKKAVLGSSAPEDDKGSADAQVAYIKAWAAREENRGWVEVAFTPADARRIIGENKLAIVLGLELDVLGNFVPNGEWTEPGAVVMPADSMRQRALIGAELDRIYAQGVRQVGPFHYVSGVFGGCAMFQRLFNELNRKFTGHNVQVVSGAAAGIRYRLDMDSWGPDGAAGRTLATGHLPDRQTDPTWEPTRLGHINAMGLTPAGEILFDEMAKRGMLIDIDHASYRSTERLLELARAREYPVMSSHSDFVELGLEDRGATPGDFSHGTYADNDEQNVARFDTTTMASLRNEGMATRDKVETIADLGGVSGPIMWLPRRMSWGDAVPNDCEGSSKTWAQNYQYAVDVTGGRGIGLSTDRITLEPRFGPNAAYLLGLEHDTMPRRDERRFEQVDAQRNGVRYDVPIREWHSFRFAPAGPSAWNKTPLGSGWEEKPWEHEDAWKGIAAWAAGRNPRTMPDHGIEPSGDPLHSARIHNYAWGLGSSNESEVVAGCGFGCDPGTLNERFAAYCVRHGITPHDIEHYRDAPGIWEHYRWVKTVWDEWQRMSGSNEPLRRHLFGNRDYDVNLDGVAHYGMLPDFLQDVANSHTRPAEVGAYLAPLFRSAESYIQMWEKALATR